MEIIERGRDKAQAARARPPWEEAEAKLRRGAIPATIFKSESMGREGSGWGNSI
jgi:hypothetical protein